MLRVDGRQIRGLQGAGGEPFTQFVDALLRSQCSIAGLADAVLHTNQRVNRQDGGVDTSIDVPLSEDRTGWLESKTVWQYKATDLVRVVLADLFAGEMLKNLITRGYAFRLAVADSITPEQRGKWDAELTRKAREISAESPQARIVSADDIAAWASRLPGLVMTYFQTALRQVANSLHSWRPNAEAETRQFVPVDVWAAVIQVLTQHVDLSQQAQSAVAPVQGDAGVGKTRMVYEVVSKLPEAQSVVLYCVGDDNAMGVANEIANDGEAYAVLVADECSLEARSRLERLLAGHRHRVRVIAIDATIERLPNAQPRLVVLKMKGETLDRILDVNFPHVPQDRRRAYAQLAEGFPRLAADLCNNDHLVVAAGGALPRIASVEEYLRQRLSPVQFEALAALALVLKAGYSADVKGELESLCSMLDLPLKQTESALLEIHNQSGFVARTSRYLYVTPEIVAQVAVREAYRRWAPNPHAFFDLLPAELLPLVVERVHRSAPEEVRRACAAHFRDWARSLTPAHLLSDENVGQLVQLVDTEPAEYLQYITDLVAEAPLELLRIQSSNGQAWRGWGPRRALVWLAERFAQFPDYYEAAESILLRLARAESEPQIGNNATATWIQLHRILLSGTAVPFGERLTKLSEQVFSDVEDVRNLAISALDEIFDMRPIRTLGPAVVAGMVPPAEWRPRTQRDVDACLALALNVLAKMATDAGPLRDAASNIAVKHFRPLVSRGFLETIRSILGVTGHSDALLPHIVEAIDEALAYDFEELGDRPNDDTERRVAYDLVEWRAQLATGSVHARVVATVGKGEWDASRVHAAVKGRERGDADNPVARELQSLAELMVGDPSILIAELPWLTSDAARSAVEFGRYLGRADERGLLLTSMLEAAVERKAPSLVRGYLQALVGHWEVLADRINPFLDDIHMTSPETAASLAISGGERLRAHRRVLELYDAGKLPPAFLADYNFGTGRRTDLSLAMLIPLVTRLAEAAAAGDQVAQRIGLDAIALRLPYEPRVEPQEELNNPDLRAAAWTLVESLTSENKVRSHWWSSLLVALGRVEALRASRLAGRLLLGDGLGPREEAERALQLLAITHPADVMEAVGEAMLDDQKGWRFFLASHDDLISSMPSEVVKAWIKRAGVEGARRIARHVPAPTIGPDGAPIVPELTEWLLSSFEDDDRTFREFCAGVHSLQVYSGDIAGQHEAEAAAARKFLNHPIRRIREWAVLEEQQAEKAAEWNRRENEESDLP